MHFVFVVRLSVRLEAQEARRLASPPQVTGLGLFDGPDLLLAFAAPVQTWKVVDFLWPSMVCSVEAASEADLRVWGWLGEPAPLRRIKWTRVPRELVVSPRMWRPTPERCAEVVDRGSRGGEQQSPEAVLVECARLLGRATLLPFERTIDLALAQASRVTGQRLTWDDVPAALRDLAPAACARCGAELELDAEGLYCSIACERGCCRGCGEALVLGVGARLERTDLRTEQTQLRVRLAEVSAARRVDLRGFQQWCREASSRACCGFSASFNPCVGCDACTARYREGARQMELQAESLEALQDRCDEVESLLSLPHFALEVWRCARCA